MCVTKSTYGKEIMPSNVGNLPQLLACEGITQPIPTITIEESATNLFLVSKCTGRNIEIATNNCMTWPKIRITLQIETPVKL